MLQNIMRFTSDYKSPARVWIGPELIIGIWKPSQLEVILNSSHTLGKAKMYDVAKMLVGNGLFTADGKVFSRWSFEAVFPN